MSLSWGICIGITRDVMKMIDEGESLKAIRAQIEKPYSKYGPPTPTPPVPWTDRNTIAMARARRKIKFSFT